MPPFRWEDIDHSLVSLKLTDLAEDMRRLTEADERRIQFENRGNLNSNAVPSLVLKMKQERADDWARIGYEIYCEVWQTQGYAKSAAFVRAVFAQGIIPVLRARANGIIGQFSLFAQRTNFPSTIYNAHALSIRLNMQRLEDRWRRRLEAEAKECEHAERMKKLGAIETSSSLQQNHARPQNPSEEGTVPRQAMDGTLTRKITRKKKVDLSRYLDTANLTEKQYECSSLRWEYGLSVSVIALELGRTRKTVDQHIQAAQAKMRSSGQYENVKKKLSQVRPGE